MRTKRHALIINHTLIWLNTDIAIANPPDQQHDPKEAINGAN